MPSLPNPSFLQLEADLAQESCRSDYETILTVRFGDLRSGLTWNG